jgi:tRNA (guanine-N7-)-methyltransferase
MASAPDPLSIRRLYGRSQGHPLRTRAAGLVAELLPALAIPADGPLTAHRLFGDDRPMELEVGFGKGEHVAFQAARALDTGFLACEPFLNGVAGLLAEVANRGLGNVRIHQGDAIDVLERLPERSLRRVWLLHPDPWPKARHAKRRFVNPGPMRLVASRLVPGGEFRLATDHVLYLRHALCVMQGMAGFRWTATGRQDWEAVPDDWPDTRFGAKARALGHDIWRLTWQRTAG